MPYAKNSMKKARSQHTVVPDPYPESQSKTHPETEESTQGVKGRKKIRVLYLTKKTHNIRTELSQQC